MDVIPATHSELRTTDGVSALDHGLQAMDVVSTTDSGPRTMDAVLSRFFISLALTERKPRGVVDGLEIR